MEQVRPKLLEKNAGFEPSILEPPIPEPLLFEEP
jgi:hypothetical protein